MLSPLFPHRQLIQQAAQVSLQIDAYRARNQPIPANLMRVDVALAARYERLPPEERHYVALQYQTDRENIAMAAHQQAQANQANQFAEQVNALTRDLTKGLAGKPNGVPMQLASALRNHSVVEVATRKLPVGAEADARMVAATGLTTKQYEKKLDAALAVRDKAKNSDFGVWRDYVAEHFPGQSFGEVNKLVRDWALESVGLEMQRRAQADQPDVVELRATPEDRRRLDILEAVAEVEGTNGESVMARGPTERLNEIAEEGYDREGQPRGGDAGLRRDIANAFLAHGGTFEVNTGGYGGGHDADFATDEIVGLEE